MATFLYDKGRKHFCFGDIVWKNAGGSTIKLTLLDNGYTPAQATHEYMNLDTILAAAKVGSPATLVLVDAADGGVIDATDPVFSGLSGDQVVGVAIWKDGGGGGTTQSGTTDLLIAYIDNFTGFPFTPSGADYTLQFDNGANKIAKI